MRKPTSIVRADTAVIRTMVHVVRGRQVMLDSDLAGLYGYTTKDFNRQVKNNIEKFDDDFMFLLTAEETANLRCKFSTSSWGGSRYRPHAFTEQGVYMLMTVLKGDLATRQSKAIIRTFKMMKDYIVGNQNLLGEYGDFAAEYGNVELRRSGGIFHDRYIVLDFGRKTERIFHCGASSKDGGNRVTTIEEVSDREIYRPLIARLAGNKPLELK